MPPGRVVRYNFRMRRLSFVFAFSLLSVVFSGASAPARADDTYTFVVKKQEEKAKSRWSLQEWIDTRDRMRMMDLWLALHSPSPYEFYLGGAWQVGELSSGGRYNGLDLQAAAYASIFGLEFQRESGLDTRYTGLMHLRVFGFHYQATHIRLEGGLKHEDAGGGLAFRNALAGVGVAVYLGKHFGLDGLYRHAFDSTPNAAGLAFGGDRFEGGAFIDFSFLRVFGKYLYEKVGPEASNLVAGSVRQGPVAGLRLFF